MNTNKTRKRLHLLTCIFVLVAFGCRLDMRAANPICAAGHLAELGARVVTTWEDKLSNQLKLNLDQLAITARTRWASIADVEERRLFATAELHFSVARAEATAIFLSGSGLGTKTAGQYAEMLGSGRVLKSSADLDKAGKGLGRFVADKGDDYVDATLVRRKANIDFLNEAPNNIVFSEAEMLVDLDDLFDAWSTMPAADKNKFLENLKVGPANYGPLSELHTAGALGRRNIKITAIEPDFYSPNGVKIPRKPVDFVGDNGLVYQNKATATLIENELVNNSNLASDIMAVEAVHGHGSYKFTFSQGNFSSDLQTRINDLNTALENLGSSRRFTPADFIKFPWEQQ